MRRILVVSATSWNTNNSFGNSYANIFDGLKGYEIANIYCKEGVVNDKRVSRAFKLTARMLLKNLKSSSVSVGEETSVEEINVDKTGYSDGENTIINFVKKHRFQIFFWAYDWIWCMGRWNSKELKDFVENYKPDLLFCPIYIETYMNKIVLELKKQTGVPLLGYISDDNYTLRMVNFSPFYWANRLIKRRSVKKVINQCDILYVISDIQKKEYDRIFHKDSHILTKGKDFSVVPPEFKKNHELPYILVYAGNIGGSRWKTLAVIAEVIKNINQGGSFFQMKIYTATPLSNRMRKKLNISGCCEVLGKIPYSEVAKKQEEADLLVHAAPTDMIHRWEEHHGFSTKLVDYMASNRAILAYGYNDQASIAHLRNNDAALVASNKAELKQIFQNIIDNPQLLVEYGEKAWICGKNHHDIKDFHKMLEADFNSILQYRK